MQDASLRELSVLSSLTNLRWLSLLARTASGWPTCVAIDVTVMTWPSGIWHTQTCDCLQSVHMGSVAALLAFRLTVAKTGPCACVRCYLCAVLALTCLDFMQTAIKHLRVKLTGCATQYAFAMLQVQCECCIEIMTGRTCIAQISLWETSHGGPGQGGDLSLPHSAQTVQGGRCLAALQLAAWLVNDVASGW